MKTNNIGIFKLRSLAAAFLTMFALLYSGSMSRVFAHGGEDHGDAKPKTETTAAGTVSRTARLGDFEITLKHSALEPDTAASARLFVTKFATNEAVDEAVPTIEIESANGSVTQIAVEKTDRN